MPGILEKHIFLADSAEELEGSCRQQARTRRPWAADAFAHHTSPRAPATGPVHLLCSLPGARYPCLSTWWAPVLRHSCLGSNAPSQRPSLAMLATAVPPHAHDPPASLLHSARWHKKLTSLWRAPSWEAQPGTPRGRLLQCGGDETGQVERHRTERERSDPPPSTMPRSCTQGPVTEAGPSRGTRTRPDALGGGDQNLERYPACGRCSSHLHGGSSLWETPPWPRGAPSRARGETHRRVTPSPRRTLPPAGHLGHWSRTPEKRDSLRKSLGATSHFHPAGYFLSSRLRIYPRTPGTVSGVRCGTTDCPMTNSGAVFRLFSHS